MNVYKQPTNDIERAGFLTRVLETGKADQEKGRGYLDDKTLAAVEELTPRFSKIVQDGGELLSNRIKEVRERTLALEELERYVRDLWEVLKRRVVRHREPEEVLVLYGLSKDGRVPKPTNPDAWMKQAEGAISGDKQAVDAGYPAMTNPSAVEISKMLEDARRESGDVPPADRLYQVVQKQLAELRPRADELIGDIIADLRHYLRKEDPSSMRRIMRTYGAQFANVQGALVNDDADDVVEDVVDTPSDPVDGVA